MAAFVDCYLQWYAQHDAPNMSLLDAFPPEKERRVVPSPANFLPSQPVKLHAELLIFLHEVLRCKASHLSSDRLLPTDDGRAIIKSLIVVLLRSIRAR